jgi:hypothetical protein
MCEIPVLDSHQQVRWPLAILVASLLAACSGGGGESDAPSASSSALSIDPRPVAQSDLEIATAIYSGKRTPDDFYSETEPSGHDVIATMHLKNTDIDPTIDASQPQFELCTNDWNQALGWSETSAQHASQYSDLVATNDDARYFEFGRVRQGSPEVYVQARVYKCAYLDRARANLRAASGSAGQLNVRPIDATELARLSEYLWQFTRYNNFGHTVLKSSGAGGVTLEHTLYMASVVRGGLSASCDRIDVIAWRHSVDPASGAVTLNVQPLWSFGARETGGMPELCTH